jgi:hypothetical protein
MQWVGTSVPTALFQPVCNVWLKTPRCIWPWLANPPYLKKLSLASSCGSRSPVDCHADEVIGMDERPAQALRAKPRSSMRIALEMVRDGQAQACVSAGNTGALMALARAGIENPAWGGSPGDGDCDSYA